MIKRLLAVVVTIAAAFIVPASAAQAHDRPAYPAARTTITVEDSSLRPGQTVWVRVTGEIGKTATLTVGSPSTAARRYVVVIPDASRISRKSVKASTPIADVDSTGVAMFQVTLQKVGRYTLTGSVADVRRSNKSLTVQVRPAPSYRHSNYRSSSYNSSWNSYGHRYASYGHRHYSYGHYWA